MKGTKVQTAKLETVAEIAMSLSASDRRVLLEIIRDSLPAEDEEDDIVEYPPELIAEWNRRVKDIESGKERTIPAEEVFQSLREKYG